MWTVRGYDRSDVCQYVREHIQADSEQQALVIAYRLCPNRYDLIFVAVLESCS